MLRLLVGVLLLANLGYGLWLSGALAGVGLGPSAERDPARRSQQVRPESIRILTAPAAAGSSVPASASPADAGAGAGGRANPSAAPVALVQASQADASLQGTCLEAGPWVGEGATAALDEAERALAGAGIASSGWQRLRLDVPAQFGVVLGPFNSRDSLQAKREELARLRLVGEEIALRPEGSGTSTTARPGLALARYDTRPAADAGLAGYNQRGVRTARVNQLRGPGIELRLRAPAASPAIAEQLRRFSGPPFGLGFQPCDAAR